MHTSVRALCLLTLLAQSGWLFASFSVPADKSTVAAARAVAVGTNVIAAALSVQATTVGGYDSAAAAACLLSAGTTAVYASSLEKSTRVARMGHGAALLSLASGVGLLALTFDTAGPSDGDYYADYDVVYYCEDTR
nr:hypothetical protein TetV2_00154 [Oceanusvirus sp.]